MAANATAEAESDPPRLRFDCFVKLARRSSSILSDGGLWLHREPDDALGPTDLAAGPAGWSTVRMIREASGAVVLSDSNGRGATAAWRDHALGTHRRPFARFPSLARARRQDSPGRNRLDRRNLWPEPSPIGMQMA